MIKNGAGQKWVVFAFDVATALPVTGGAANITANLRLDGGEANPIDQTNPDELERGYYVFDLTQAETNADSIVICPASSAEGVVVIGVPGAVWPRLPAIGAGALSWAYSLTDDATADPIAGASVWVTTDSDGHNVVATGITDAFGVCTFYLDPGTVYVFRQKEGYNFDNPDVEVVQ